MSNISVTSDFASELARAVNQIHLLTLEERKGLVARGINCIHELKHALDSSGADTPMASRTLRDIETLISEMEDTPDELVAAAFLVLCEQINRMLSICESVSETKKR